MNNPISCILCACEVIGRSNSDPFIAEAADLIRGAVRNMENMTRELIDFSRGQTQLNLDLVMVEDLIKAIQADFSRYRPEVELEVELHYEGPIRADRHRLLRVFNNLIRNACEAMAKSDEKRVTLAVKPNGSALRWEISDTGCGIPAELLPRIFEPFVTHGKSSGTGLGLAIAKAVVEAHQGTISVQSSDRGTTFTLDLPIQA
jgi:signal transduction histidine kinase